VTDNACAKEQRIPGVDGVHYHKMEAAVAFLDLLGFKQYVSSDQDAAYHLLEDYKEILISKLSDKKNHPSSTYDNKELGQYAKKVSIEDFNYFLPFSDSIIIVSKSPDAFLNQLSAFLYDCFYFKKNAYANPINNENITKSEIINIPSRSITKTHCYPVLFRVGLSYGECMAFPAATIIDDNYRTHCNLFGHPYIKAVALEQSGEKGPRVICDDAFCNTLSPQSKAFVQQISGSQYYELLWVGLHIYDSTSGEDMKNTFLQLVDIACKFWNMYAKDAKTEPHYRQFLRLIYHSARKVDCLTNNDISNQLLTQIEQVCKANIVDGFLESIAK